MKWLQLSVLDALMKSCLGEFYGLPFAAWSGHARFRGHFMTIPISEKLSGDELHGSLRWNLVR